MQRGEPAIVDKWTRAQMAPGKWRRLGSGIAPFSQCSGSRFLRPRGCGYLASLGIDNLAFGTEEVLDYQKIAGLIHRERC